MPRAALRCPGCQGERGWAREWRGLPVVRLEALSVCGLPTQLTRTVPLSVISAKVKLALLCRSMFWLYTSVLNALRGSPEKKSVSCLCRPICLACDSSYTRVCPCLSPSFVIAYIFEVVQQVGNSFAFRVGEDIVVVYFRAACGNDKRVSLGDAGPGICRCRRVGRGLGCACTYWCSSNTVAGRSTWSSAAAAQDDLALELLLSRQV